MKLIFLLLLFIFTFSHQTFLRSTNSVQSKCHPQCSWKCDDPHCPAICDPVCEPPKCHISCAEPKNAICDVKCEKPDCEIKCPDKGCEGLDCPKCVTVCKQPHCVTHCQAPKPECEPVCEEPKCDWKCHKPQCPKPKCELVCENPNCTPQVECCNCLNGQKQIDTPFPFFKETESNQGCCGCNPSIPNTIILGKNGENIYDDYTNKRKGTTITDIGSHIVKDTVISDTQIFEHPKAIGESYYKIPTKEIDEFEGRNSQQYTVGKKE